MPEYDFSDGFNQLEGTCNGSGDRVPVFAQLHEFAMQWNGISGKRFYSSPWLYVRGVLSLRFIWDLTLNSYGFSSR